MASAAYYQWVKDGRDYTLIRPARAVQATLRGYGLTVYDYPNDAHLKASTPEDHTPFSATGWPGTNRKYNARALDVMPRNDTTAALRENAGIARQLIADRDAGVPGAMWIKYLNWTDEKGVTRQERWTDASNPLKRTTRSSTDRGHIHISGRSDVDNDNRADGYDPVRRMLGLDTDEGEDTMGKSVLVKGFQPEPEQIWYSDGTFRRPVPDAWVYVKDEKTGAVTVSGPITKEQVHQEGILGELGWEGEVFESGGDPDVWGIDVRTLQGGTVVVGAGELRAAVRAELDRTKLAPQA